MNTSTAIDGQITQVSDNVYFCLHEDDMYLLPFGTKELHSEEYLTWMNDVEITKTLGRFDYLMPVDRSKLVDYYNAINRNNTVFLAIYLGGGLHSSQIDKTEMRFIGSLKIYDIDQLARRASIGVAIGDRANWGKGYSSKAIRIACQYIFETLGLRKITAGYIASNIGMERAFLKNGFEVEAIFKEHLYYEGTYSDHKYVCKFRG
jgi:RimJ/RimL family protein N-acetyltransferase